MTAPGTLRRGDSKRLQILMRRCQYKPLERGLQGGNGKAVSIILDDIFVSSERNCCPFVFSPPKQQKANKIRR